MLYSASPLSASTLPNDLTAAVVVSGDAYEVNNAATTAYDLTTSEGSLREVAGLATATDNDWYRVQAGEGRFEAELQSIATEGELNLQIFTADGDLLGGNYRVEDDSVVELDLAEDTELFLFVYGKGGYQGNAYNLTWNAVDPSAGSTEPTETTPPIEPTEPTEPTDPTEPAAPVAGTADRFEANQSRQTATVLSGASGSVSATATDTDFYRVDATAGEVTFTLTSVVSEGELNIELYDSAGTRLTGRYNIEPVSEVTVNLDAEGSVFALIYAKGGFQGNVYELAWTAGAPTEATEPTLPAEPTEPAEPAEPTEPTEPAEPTGPVDATASVAGTADRFEANQSRESATVLSGASGSVSATATDIDFYRVDATAGEVTFTLTSVVSEGELNIELYDNGGNRLTGRYNIEPVSEVTVNLDAEGPVFAFIYAKGGFQGNVYELAWTGGVPTERTESTEPAEPTEPTQPTEPSDPAEPVDPSAPVAGAADSFESNQSRETATVLSGATGSLAATATDTDFYRLDAAAGDVTFTLTADVAEGDLNIELYDAAGVFLTGRYNVEPVSEVSFTLDADGPVFAFIYARGGFEGNVYELEWAADGTGDSGGPVDPADPTDPLTPADTTEPSDSLPVLEAVIRQGVADWVQAALTGRADVLVLGDSVVFKDGVGWDGGLNAGFDRTLGLAGTGLLSGNYSNSNGAGYGYESFGQNPSNWGFAFVPGTDVAAITNDEINSDEYARSQHPWGEVTVNARRGTVAELGVQVSREGDNRRTRPGLHLRGLRLGRRSLVQRHPDRGRRQHHRGGFATGHQRRRPVGQLRLRRRNHGRRRVPERRHHRPEPVVLHPVWQRSHAGRNAADRQQLPPAGNRFDRCDRDLLGLRRPVDA